MSETGGRVSHGVMVPWKEGKFRAVAVVALVFTLALAQMRRCSRGGSGSFVHASKCGGVVRSRADGALAHVEVLGDHVEMRDGAGVLEVTVGEVPVGVCAGHHASHDGGGEHGSPHGGPLSFHEEDSPHT